MRAKWIAETFLTDAKEVTNVRGILGFTGKASDGSIVSVMASGMGMPSIGIYSHELFTSYGVEAIIRIGTIGALSKKVKLRDLVIGEGACTNSNWMGQHNLYDGTYSAIADYDLLEAAVSSARARSLPCHVGNILSSDTFYDYRPDVWKKWANLGVLGTEMEAFSLYEQAAELGKKALAICTVSDLIYGNEVMTAEERQNGLKNMVLTSMDVAMKFAKR